MMRSGADRLAAWIFTLSLPVMAVSGIAQMPIFKRYYIADIPGLEFLAQFFVTLKIHYIGGMVFLCAGAFLAMRWMLGADGMRRLTPLGRMRVGLLVLLVATGWMRVIKNLPGYYFSPELTMIVDWTHLAFAMGLGIVAILGVRRTRRGRARYVQSVTE